MYIYTCIYSYVHVLVTNNNIYIIIIYICFLVCMYMYVCVHIITHVYPFIVQVFVWHIKTTPPDLQRESKALPKYKLQT